MLRLIKMTCDAGRDAGKPVSLCGEIAGDSASAPLLMGLGVTELSAPLPAVAVVKQTVRGVRLDRCIQLANDALACSTGQEVRNLLERSV